MALTGKNMLDELNKINFENKDNVMHLYPPEKNSMPNPQFKSIVENLRELDKNPYDAVIL